MAYILLMKRLKEFERLDQIAQAIYDKKGFNTIVLDVKDISSFTEYFLIAEGSVPRHVAALARAIIESQESLGHKPSHVEGLQTADWIVIDYGYIVVHLFQIELRERYALEALWRQGTIVDLNIDVSKEAHHE